MNKRFVSILLTFAILITAFVFPANAVNTSPMTGATFTNNHSYSVVDYSETGLRTVPKTMEAWVNYDTKSSTSHYSTIFGNYHSSSNKYAYRLVLVNAVPKVDFRYSSDGTNVSTYTLSFDEVSVPVNEWVFLAISFDVENSKAHFYLNGELKQTLSLEAEHLAVLNYQWEAIPRTDTHTSPQFATLGTYRSSVTSTNRRDFYGEIAYFAAYSDVRNDLEVSLDYAADYKTPDTENMLLGYDLSVDGRVAYEDLSGNDNRLAWNGRDFANLDEYAEVSENDYAFSFAVIGDTQALNQSANETVFQPMFNWIKNNVYSKNIKAVISVGDITNKNTPVQWQNAKEAYSKLDGIVPTFPILGNHDNTEQYDETAKVGLYKEYMTFEKTDMSDSYDGSINTYYQKIHVGGIKYLILAISYGHTAEERLWAKNVIENNPDYNVIITTHAYMFGNGEHLNRDGAPNLYEELVLPYSNIVLVTCGHMRGDNVKLTTDTRSDGSVVQQLFTNPQDADASLAGGIVTMLYFSEDGKSVKVRNYSTALDCYLGSENPTEFTLDLQGEGVYNERTVTADDSGKITLPEEINGGRGLFVGWKNNGEFVTENTVFTAIEEVTLTAEYVDFDTVSMQGLVDTTGNSPDNNPVPKDAKYINGLYLQGAQVRIPEKEQKTLGLRFITANNVNITKALEENGMVVERGMVVVSDNYIGDGDELLIGLNKSLTVKADYVFKTDSELQKDYDKYTVCVINIPENYMQTKVVVRPYYIYTDLSGIEHVYYGEQYSCSLYEAARSAYEAKDGNGNLIESNETRQALFDRILSKFVGDNDDGSLKWDQF